MRYTILASLVALSLTSWRCPEASAHAVLLERYPTENALLASPPDQVRLRFDERVSPVLVHVLDASGKSVTGPGDVSEVNTTVLIRLPGNLPSGSYVVSYRVISADSHPLAGSFVFSIGQTTPGAGLTARVADASDLPAWTAIATALRALFYAAFLMAVGGSLFIVFVDRRSLAARADQRDILAACVIGTILLLMSLGVEGGSAAAAPLIGIFDPAVWRIGIRTTMGVSAIATVLGFAILGFGLVRGAGKIVVCVGSILAVAGFALTGHVAAAQPRWLTAPILALHVLCVSYWVGALPPLYRRLGADSSEVAAQIVARFSQQVIYVVSLLVASGLLIAAVQVESPAALIGTAYGQRLLAKLVLVSALLVLAALNKMRLTPALARDESDAARRLRRSIAAEAVLFAGVLVATAMLGQQTPPRALLLTAPEHHHPETMPEGLAVTATAGKKTALVELRSAHPGEYHLTMTLTGDDGAPMAPLELSIRLSSPALGVEPSDYQGARVAPGRYVATVPLPIAGVWTVEIEALVTDFETVIFTATVLVR